MISRFQFCKMVARPFAVVAFLGGSCSFLLGLVGLLLGLLNSISFSAVDFGASALTASGFAASALGALLDGGGDRPMPRESRAVPGGGVSEMTVRPLLSFH